MADDHKNYRDPKVTETRTTASGTNWVWIAVAAVVLVLLLGWVFGWFGTNRVATVPQDGVGTTIDGGGVPATGTGTGAQTGTSTAPGAPADGTAPATEAPADGTGTAPGTAPQD